MTRNAVRAQGGFTLIEVLIAMGLMAVGITATLGVFGGAGRTTLAAQRSSAATQQAQGALDRLSKMKYETLGLVSTPAASSNPLNPGSRVSGTTFVVRTGLTESFVLSTDTGQSGAAVDPAPQSFAVGSGSSAITGKVYRYVTWRDETCSATSACDGTQNSKRLTVAVTIDAGGTLAARAPVWISQVIPDPRALPASAPAPPPSSSPPTGTSAQNFYLYDTPCGQTSRTAPSVSHPTHNTASAGPVASLSFCENPSAALQPDLMAPQVPTGGGSTTYKYSSDVTGVYNAGLAMTRKGTTCPTSYPAAAFNDPAAPVNQYSIHAWSTNKFSSTFTLNGQVTLSFFTATLGGASGNGQICATLLNRTVTSGVPADTSLGSYTYTLATWPTTLRRISFTFKLPTPVDILTDHRLVLVLGVTGNSANDLYFVYDHPSYATFLQVATPTPL
jgi:prepilin-type N-terminal cleavage/methylation domain-containing protein